jgi:hypothetical protein
LQDQKQRERREKDINSATKNMQKTKPKKKLNNNPKAQKKYKQTKEI